jgi:hypothetical protein
MFALARLAPAEREPFIAGLLVGLLAEALAMRR